MLGSSLQYYGSLQGTSCNLTGTWVVGILQERNGYTDELLQKQVRCFQVREAQYTRRYQSVLVPKITQYNFFNSIVRKFWLQ